MNLPVLKTECAYCLSEIVFSEGKTVVYCDACGRCSNRPKSEKKETDLMKRANENRNYGRFDRAAAQYEKVLEKNLHEAEARWGLLLCRYGVIYLEDPKKQERVITCRRRCADSILSDPEFLAACEDAPEEVRLQYLRDAEYIDKIQREIRSLAANGVKYDVFICYKETDPVTGERTKDSVRALNMYQTLGKEGYNVFYAPESLKNHLGANYEAAIFNAIETSKVMLAMGFRPEYFETTWMQSEWRRFLEKVKADEERVIIPMHGDFPPEQLPAELSELQALNLYDYGLMGEVKAVLKRVIPQEEESAKPAELSDEEFEQVAQMLASIGLAQEMLMQKAAEMIPDALRALKLVFRVQQIQKEKERRRAEAVKAAEEEKRKAEDEARRKAEEKKKAEEEQKKKDEETARLKAELERLRKEAEEAKKRKAAEEEARRLAEEKKKAEEEQKKKDEETARLKAELERLRKEAEEAKKRKAAEEEARRLAEEKKKAEQTPEALYERAEELFDENADEAENAEAIRLYKLAAERGSYDAQYQLYHIYWCGKGAEKNAEEAVKWLLMMAKDGDVEAQADIGEHYYHGWGVEENQIEARKWLIKAVEQGNKESCFYLGQSYQNAPEDLAEAAKWFRVGAEAGDRFCQRCLAEMYERGEGVAKDLDEAEKWYRMAAEQGDKDAQAALERVLKAKPESAPKKPALPEKKYDAVIVCRETDADMKPTPDKKWASDMYRYLTKEGFDVFYEPISLAGWFAYGSEYEARINQAIDSARFMIVVGTNFENLAFGRVMEQYTRFLKRMDRGEDCRLIPAVTRIFTLPKILADRHLQSVNLSEPNAMGEIAALIWKVKNPSGEDLFDKALRFYDENASDAQNAKAVEMMLEAAEEFSTKAALWLGNYYYDRRDYDQALEWYGEAFEDAEFLNQDGTNEVSAEAAFVCGRHYELGDGFAKSPATAAKWYEKAAALGSEKAKNALERLREKESPQELFDRAEGLFDDDASEEDNTIAVDLYKQAAKGGLAEAQCKLGEKYAYGIGVEKNRDEAAKWLRMAVEQGYREAYVHMGFLHRFLFGDATEAEKWYRMAAERGDEDARDSLKQLEELKQKSKINRRDHVNSSGEIKDSWEQIFASIDDGTYKDKYAVNDYKHIALGSEGYVYMQIVAFDTDERPNGKGKAPITWVSKDLLITERCMNKGGFFKRVRNYGEGALGGWEHCELRKVLRDNIMPLIPDEVRNRILSVVKTQESIEPDQCVVNQTTFDRVWIPDAHEISGTKAPYGKALGSSAGRRRGHLLGGANKPKEWWLRSVNVFCSFKLVEKDGSINSRNSYYDYGVVIGFCT